MSGRCGRGEWMRYHFNIRSGDTVIRDREGAEYETLADARCEAVRSARELLAEMLLRGEVVNGRSIEICDRQGIVLDVVMLREQVRLP